MDKFNTVEEKTSWGSFVYKEQVYNLSHLDAHFAEYTDKEGKIYKYIVGYDNDSFIFGP